MPSDHQINRRDFVLNLSQSALALTILGRSTKLLAAKKQSKPLSVVVLGAGLSGLYSALLLEQQGFRVTILEARERIGGRVHTLEDVPGKVEISRKISWGDDPFAQGAYHYFAPGQIQALQQKMSQPWGRIHFAGEHTAIATPGMESALESAERAVEEISSY